MSPPPTHTVHPIPTVFYSPTEGPLCAPLTQPIYTCLCLKQHTFFRGSLERCFVYVYRPDSCSLTHGQAVHRFWQEIEPQRAQRCPVPPLGHPLWDLCSVTWRRYSHNLGPWEVRGVHTIPQRRLLSHSYTVLWMRFGLRVAHCRHPVVN